ncbi:putative pre-mrna cleavage factor cfi subunit [Moniliophthora roreri MCA 2997]|uniref:Pre-mrna cleavage factor cfi subunit n=1 Tax=Moniliophthora roreri (strain MCA 2997) TaxID=1381753 RepID=V2XL01_MONRO|nr:putative pre-mrna cleavage factor cfi subunit [Moniliophthora roreri MCA 2997]
MSMYSSPAYYSQPPYGGPQSYAQSPSGYPPFYHPPHSHQPAPVFHHVDPATFRRDFSNRLAELTMNSRPIIQSLSMYAQDHVRFAEIVAQCLEAHIRKVPPWMKLPSFYLLDMISKNIYEPYARVFAGFVIPLFIETYQQVDNSTRSKMVELVLTWRTGSPTGKELFGVPAQVSIERSIWAYSSSGQITKAQVLSELEFTLGQKERALQANPADLTAQNHVNVLQQLRKLVEAGVSQAELQQILGQLRTLMRSATQPPPPPAHAAPPPQPAWLPFPSTPSSVAPSAQPSFTPPVTNVQLETVPVASSSIIPDQPSLPTAGPSFAALLSTLVKSGVVSAGGTPTGAGATAKEEASNTNIAEASAEREAIQEYRSLILNQSAQLSTTGLTRTRPSIHTLLYRRLSAQCKQCGIRFPDTTNGKKDLQDHLDMHFRQNLKANQNIGRGHSRSWFIDPEDWTHDISDVKGKGRADGHRPLNPRAAAAAEAIKKDAELRAQFVVIPPGDEAKTIACPICKEILNPEFVEDDEEWVWKNAVKKDDRIYHATCHAEASSNTLAARLRSDVPSSRSRSGTPEKITKQSTPPRGSSLSPETRIAGMKRKANDENSSIKGEPEGRPHLKKLALAVVS